MMQLRETGVVVVPMYDARECDLKAQQFMHDLRNAPELKTPFLETEQPLVQLGGCGFIGLPSMQYRQATSQTRGLALRIASKLIAGDRNVQMFMDRPCIRLVGQSPDGESTHRDLSDCLPSDDIFGGWVNLSKSVQHFNCIPGTHNDPTYGQGFALIRKEELPLYAGRMVTIAVPSGHLLLFNQNLLHEVRKNPAGEGYIRQHVGFRSTLDTSPMIDNSAAIRDMGVPLIKSGQRPRLYAKMHNACFQHKTFNVVKKRKGIEAVAMVDGLEGFSKRFKDAMIGTNGIVKAVSPSLRELGCMLPPLSAGETELAIGTPKRSWDSLWDLSESGIWEETPFAI